MIAHAEAGGIEPPRLLRSPLFKSGAVTNRLALLCTVSGAEVSVHDTHSLRNTLFSKEVGHLAPLTSKTGVGGRNRTDLGSCCS